MEKQAMMDRLQHAGEEILMAQRENNISIMPFAFERELLQHLANGNQEALLESCKNVLENSFSTWDVKLSRNMIRQAQYAAVTGISLACRVSMQEGVPEPIAYAYSDSAIQLIDTLTDPQMIIEYTLAAMLQYTNLVQKHKEHSLYPQQIRNVINYIEHHLHEKLTLDLLAKQTTYSKNYFAILFQKTTGMNVTDYIMHQRIQKAKTLMDLGQYSGKEITYMLGFCNQSHFADRFKKVTGITPQQYMQKQAIHTNS